MKKIFAILILISMQINIFAQSDDFAKVNSDLKKSTITYSMHHPLHSWEATSSDVHSVILINDDKTIIKQVAVVVKIATFDSQNANRDSHMIEVTDAIKYPLVKFESTSITSNGNNLSVVGNLTFHGITKKISFNATKSIQVNQVNVIGGFSINMTDYDIKRPSLMGMPTDDEIKFNFRMFY